MEFYQQIRRRMKNRRGDFVLWAILALLMLGVLISSIDYAMDTKKENVLLKQALIDEKQINSIMSRSINDLRRELSESWGNTLICMNASDNRDLYPCGSKQ